VRHSPEFNVAVAVARHDGIGQSAR
jgi:hypothetical protein